MTNGMGHVKGCVLSVMTRRAFLMAGGDVEEEKKEEG